MFGTTYTMFSSQSIHNSWTAWTSWVGPYSTKTLMEMSIRWGQAQGKFLQDKSTVTVTVCHYTWGLFSLPQYQRCVISCLSIHLWKSTSPTASLQEPLSFVDDFENPQCVPLKAALENQPQAFPRKKYSRVEDSSDVCWRTLTCTIIHLTSLFVPASLFILFQRWNKLMKSFRI